MFSRKCGRTSSVVNTLASGARGPRSDPLLQRGKFRYPNTLSRSFSSVICKNDTSKVHLPLDLDDNWMSPVHGKVPLVQVKEPYGNLDMVTSVEARVRQKDVIVNAEKYFHNSPSIILHGPSRAFGIVSG